jgi:hypothetical protein
MCELSALHLTTLAEHILPMHRLQKLFIVHTGCAINVIIQNFKAILPLMLCPFRITTGFISYTT